MNHRQLLSNYHLIPQRIYYKNHTKIVDTNRGTFVIKKKNNHKKELFDYLESRKFNFYLPLENQDTDPYEIYPFIEDRLLSSSDKAVDLIYTMSMLHIKTTTYEEINKDEVKKIYEETKQKIEYLYAYYWDLQDYIETKVYMAPEEYLLIKNMDQIYRFLNFSKEKIEQWYQEKINMTKERKVFIHNNITLDHFLASNQAYLIHWDEARKDIVIYDFLNFYKQEYHKLEMISLFELYQSRYPYTPEEKTLFLSLLALPWKVELKKDHYQNTIVVKELVTYMKKTRKFILKENKKDQKTNEEKLEQ